MFDRRRTKYLIMISIFALVLSGCSPFGVKGGSEGEEVREAPNTDKQIVIGLALGTLAEERWVNEKKYFEDEAAKYGAKVLSQDANMDENVQNAQIENLIRQKVDVLVIAAVNAKTASASVTAAKAAGIPVLAYSRMINGADLDAFIGFDAIAMGETLARAAVAKVPKGTYMIVNGAPIDNNARSQHVGYFNILQPFIDQGQIKVVSDQWCDNWAPERALTAVEKALEENNNKIDAFLVSNDGMAGGVIQALKARGLDGKVFVSGTDGEKAALQRIEKGSQTATLLFPQKEFAEEGARAAISLANRMVPADATGKTFNGCKDVPTIFAKIVLVTRANLNEVIMKNHISRVEEGYTNAPKNGKP